MFCLEFHLCQSPIFKYGKSMVLYGFPEKQSFLILIACKMVILSASLNPMDRKCSRERKMSVSSVLIKQHWVPKEEIFLLWCHGGAWDWASIPLDPAIWPCSKKSENPFHHFCCSGNYLITYKNGLIKAYYEHLEIQSLHFGAKEGPEFFW